VLRCASEDGCYYSRQNYTFRVMASAQVSQGKEIRALRDRAGLTQEEAAEKLDMKTRTYGAYEREERDVSYKQMQKIRRVLGARVETSVTRSYGKNVKQYPVADSGESSTVLIDTQIINVEGRMPEPDQAEVHRVNTRWMGPWMSADMALVQSKSRIDGPGRYVVRWADGEDKVVLEAWRYGESKVCVRTHAPENKTVFEEVEQNVGLTVFRRDDGTELNIEVIGKVVFPDDDVQLMTEGMADTAARIVNNGGVNSESE